MAIPDPTTTEWVPLYSKNVIRGPAGPAGLPGPEGPQGIGTDVEYVGNYTPAIYNTGDIVVATDNIAYMCVKNGTTTPPEPWPITVGSGGNHAITHNTAGSDPLTDISGGIITSGTIPDARLTGTILNTTVTQHTSQINSINANAAFKNQANTFTSSIRAPDFTADSLYPLYALRSGDPANSRDFYIENWSQNLRIAAYNDDRSALQGNLSLSRGGNLFVSGSINERNRSYPIGEWIAYTPNLYGLTIQTTYASKYMLIGKTLYINFYFSATITLPSPPIALYLPSPYVAAIHSASYFLYGTGFGMAQASPGSNYLNLYKDIGGAALPTGATMIGGVATIEIQ